MVNPNNLFAKHGEILLYLPWACQDLTLAML